MNTVFVHMTRPASCSWLRCVCSTAPNINEDDSKENPLLCRQTARNRLGWGNGRRKDLTYEKQNISHYTFNVGYEYIPLHRYCWASSLLHKYIPISIPIPLASSTSRSHWSHQHSTKLMLCKSNACARPRTQQEKAQQTTAKDIHGMSNEQRWINVEHIKPW